MAGTVWSLGLLFFILVYIDKQLDGKISSIVASFHFRGKAHNDVEREDQTKKIIAQIEKLLIEHESRIIIKILNERDKKND